MQDLLIGIAVVLVVTCMIVAGEKMEKKRRMENPAYTGIDNVSVRCIRGYVFAVYDGSRGGGVTQMFQNTQDGLRAMECERKSGE